MPTLGPGSRSVLLNDLHPTELAALDRELLLPSGHLRLMPARDLRAFGLDRLRVWSVHRARYQLVTEELVTWLRERIGERSAIEVGAGMGDLGHHLSVAQTDLGTQREVFADVNLPTLRQQAPTDPPPSVERVEAEVAVAKYKPAVVVAAWLTERPHLSRPAASGDDERALRAVQSLGVEEVRMIRAVESYIHIGNSAVHGLKRVLRLKHRTYRPDWLVSRALEPQKDLIYVWGR